MGVKLQLIIFSIFQFSFCVHFPHFSHVCIFLFKVVFQQQLTYTCQRMCLWLGWNNQLDSGLIRLVAQVELLNLKSPCYVLTQLLQSSSPTLPQFQMIWVKGGRLKTFLFWTILPILVIETISLLQAQYSLLLQIKQKSQTFLLTTIIQYSSKVIIC